MPDRSMEIVCAQAYVRGLIAMTGIRDDEPIEGLTGFQLNQMLEPVDELLCMLVKDMGGQTSPTPDLRVVEPAITP